LVVFQDEHASLLQRRERVEERPERRFQVRGGKGRLALEQCKSGGVTFDLEGLAGQHDVTPETEGIIVPGIKRKPGHRRMWLSLSLMGDPLAHHRRFAEASRSRQQRESAFQTRIKPRQQALSCNEGGGQTGQLEFGSKHQQMLSSRRGGDGIRKAFLKSGALPFY